MTTQLFVLVIEDSQDDADLFVLELQRGGYDVVSLRAGTREAMLAALDQEPCDVVLSDNSPLCFDALQEIRMLREVDRDIPFIVVSGTTGEEQAVEWMRAGATDYVLKSNLERLPSTVERAQREAASRHMHRQAEAQAFRLAAIVHSSEDAIISQDLQGVITSWNPSAERLYGWTAEEAVGRHISLIVPPDGADGLSIILKQLRSGQRIPHHETVRQRRDGKRVDVSLTISLMRDTQGRLLGASKIVRDISDKKQLTRY